jgi:hypothetical protein
MLISKIKKIEGGRVFVKDSVLDNCITEDGVDYYSMIVTLARGNNDIEGHKDVIERQIERMLEYRGIDFNKGEFDKAYHDFKKAKISKSAFAKTPYKYQYA